MKKLILCFVTLTKWAPAANTQTLPAKITSFLNQQYPGWRQLPGSCDSKKWFLTGDFDGDGMKDYLVRVKSGKPVKSIRLNLIAFFNAGDGNYRAQLILDDPR